jgi:hypothetical protein
MTSTRDRSRGGSPDAFDCLPVVQQFLTVLAHVTEQNRGMERDLVQRDKKDYPVTQRLQQIAGVGPLTALCFVLKIGESSRKFLGLSSKLARLRKIKSLQKFQGKGRMSR